MMKKILLYVAIIFILPYTGRSQILDKESLIFQFEENINLEYWKEGEMDKSHREKTYIENKKSNGNIDFFIAGLLFRHEKNKMQSIILSKSDFACIELLLPKQIKNHINGIKEEYPLGYKYPNDNYPTMYIAKKKSDSIILYEVKWLYYEE